VGAPGTVREGHLGVGSTVEGVKRTSFLGLALDLDLDLDFWDERLDLREVALGRGGSSRGDAGVGLNIWGMQQVMKLRRHWQGLMGSRAAIVGGGAWVMMVGVASVVLMCCSVGGADLGCHMFPIPEVVQVGWCKLGCNVLLEL
jgi:hypothetical protein